VPDLPADDLALIAAARDAITARYRPDWHVVGAALRTRAGRVFTGVHLEANVGRIAVCAEAVALGARGDGGGRHGRRHHRRRPPPRARRGPTGRCAWWRRAACAGS
jgi:hypothetical protein